MLNAKLIGSYISTLRKNKNLTQVELAEKMCVTHQAVSKWERGESLPDLGVFVELAKFFNCSVDQLLNGGATNQGGKGIRELAEMVSDRRSEEAAEVINNGKAELATLTELSPMIKPDALREVTQKINGSILNVENLVALGPFLDEETLTAALRKVNKEEMTKEALVSLAPFIESVMVDDLAVHLTTFLNEEDVLSLAPFMGDALDQVVLEKEWPRLDQTILIALAPFVKNETLSILLNKCQQEELTLDGFLELAPFLEDQLDTFLQNSQLKGMTWSKLGRLAPFVGKETLVAFIHRLPKEEMSHEDLRKLAPFLDEHLDSLMTEVSLSAELIAELAPFLRRETLKDLIQRSL